MDRCHLQVHDTCMLMRIYVVYPDTGNILELLGVKPRGGKEIAKSEPIVDV